MSVRALYRCTECNTVSVQRLLSDGEPKEFDTLSCGVCRKFGTVQKLVSSQSMRFHGEGADITFHLTGEQDATLVVGFDLTDGKSGYSQEIVLDQNDAIRLAAFLDFELMREEVE